MRQFTNYSLKIRCFIFFGFSIYVSIIHNMLKCKKGKKIGRYLCLKCQFDEGQQKLFEYFPPFIPFKCVRSKKIRFPFQ